MSRPPCTAPGGDRADRADTGSLTFLTGDDEADGAALNLITAFTGNYYDDSATCVSRHVYRWQDGVFELAPEVSG